MNGEYSLADIAAATGNGGNSNSGFGQDGWWIILLFIFIAAFGGWGNGNGWGGSGAGGGQTSSVYEGYVLGNDFSQLSSLITNSANTLERRTDSIVSGLCDGFYTNAQLINGVNMNIANAQAGITNAITTNGYENRLGQQMIGQQISDCCCGLKQQIGDVNYNNAMLANNIQNAVQTGFCQTNYNNATNTRDIVDTQNAGTQAILARIDALESARKDEKIADLQAKNFDLRLAASQEAQNRLLINELGYQCPKPAYVVQPPQQVSFATNCGGVATFANTGCGCGVNVQ